MCTKHPFYCQRRINQHDTSVFSISVGYSDILCPTRVSCWLVHLSHFIIELKIHHLYLIIITFIAFISYKDAPNVTNISRNTTVNESDTVTLICRADGNPTPSITWTRVSDNIPVFFPLTITGKEDEGGYRCAADNGVGNPDSEVTFINVQCRSIKW